LLPSRHGRPRAFDETEVIRAAAELFASRTYDEVSVDDLVMSLLTPAVVAAAMRAVPADRAGLASATNNTARQAGGAIGIAGYGALAGDPIATQFITGLHESAIITACLYVAAAVATLATIRAHLGDGEPHAERAASPSWPRRSGSRPVNEIGHSSGRITSAGSHPVVWWRYRAPTRPARLGLLVVHPIARIGRQLARRHGQIIGSREGRLT
jgi:hypothetical protein